MYCSILSGAVYGMDSYILRVEVDVSPGMPCFDMVGLPGSEVKEARERVRVALRNAGCSIPPSHITVNFAPADLRKVGSSYDLPIAIGIMVSMGKLQKECVTDVVFLGELGLDGGLRRIRGTLPLLVEAKEKGYRIVFIPRACMEEAKAVEGITVCGFDSLQEVVECLERPRGEWLRWSNSSACMGQEEQEGGTCLADFSEVSGQYAARRAAEIAAAGFHHLLLVGPPGAGKTMIASRMAGILPPMNMEERLQVSSVYSVAGLLEGSGGMIKQRPFVALHHTATRQALVGGGRIPMPGAISLAHKGVLFLDEVAEFPRATLDVLRQPMEEGHVTIARIHGNCTYPAEFMLVAAMNPCPCGYYPDRQRCQCTLHQIQRYAGHLSGPMLDRMDLHVSVQVPKPEELLRQQCGESSEKMQQRILRAREVQKERYGLEVQLLNARLGPGQLRQYALLSPQANKLLERAMREGDESARSYHKLLRIARTISDLEGDEQIREESLLEAMGYRGMLPKEWGK